VAGESRDLGQRQASVKGEPDERVAEIVQADLLLAVTVEPGAVSGRLNRKRLLDLLAERLRQDRGAAHGLTRPVVARGAHIAYSAARRGFQGSVDTRARSKNRQPPMPTSQRLAPRILKS
jgi:hypothetical protein